MGQAQSVSPGRFQEDYYMFFDEKRRYSPYSGRPGHYTAKDRRSSADPSDSAYDSIGVSDPKVVHRGVAPDVFNVSTHNEAIEESTSTPSGAAGSLYEAGDDFTERALRDDSSASETECAYREYRSPSGRCITGYWNGEEFLNGRITWMDGREYNGALKNSLPNGFGSYRTSTGSEYTGYWRCGLQHGTGVYVTVKEGCRMQRHGVWDNGQLVRWVDEEDVAPEPAAPTRRSLLEEIMATPTATPMLSPSSRALSSIPSVSASPLPSAALSPLSYVAGGVCTGDDPGYTP